MFFFPCIRRPAYYPCNNSVGDQMRYKCKQVTSCKFSARTPARVTRVSPACGYALGIRNDKVSLNIATLPGICRIVITCITGLIGTYVVKSHNEYGSIGRLLFTHSRLKFGVAKRVAASFRFPHRLSIRRGSWLLVNVP